MNDVKIKGPSTQRESNFRQDINALRAWAVLAVVGYHFQIPGFAGGFVGVDVFFAISGFLITGQVLNQLNQQKFSLIEFWVSRLRRIFPALFVITIVAVALGWYVTFPGEYMKHIRQALSAVAFASNLTFNGERGYFDAAAQTKPLLHTWSLSVEWQFYLSLPAILWLAWRLAPVSRRVSFVSGTLAIIGGASFAWCLWRSNINPGEAFFSLRARAWELLLGGIIASLELRRSNQVKLRERTAISICAVGWLLVATSTVFPLASAQWPGALTLLPVCGAGLIVLAGAKSFGSRLIEFLPVQRVGAWSYSIYLWHWPLWVFLQEWSSSREVPVNIELKLGLIAATLVLSYLSYRYVEQPTRSRQGFWSNKQLTASCVASFAVMILFTIAVLETHGFPKRFPEYQQRAELARRTNTPRDECFRDAKSSKQISAQFCDFGAAENSAKPSVILWGDSHANQYLEPITSAASSLGLHGLIATQSGCRAFLDSPSQDRGVPASCSAFNREAYKLISSTEQPSIVILGRNWVGAGEAAAKEMAELTQNLLDEGETVVLILPSLNFGVNVTERWLHDQSKAGKAIDDWSVPVSAELLEQNLRHDIAVATAPFAGNPRFITVDPVPVVCENSYCYLVRHGQANFRDTAHISNVNAMQYEAIFADALHKASEAASLTRALEKEH